MSNGWELEHSILENIIIFGASAADWIAKTPIDRADGGVNAGFDFSMVSKVYVRHV